MALRSSFIPRFRGGPAAAALDRAFTSLAAPETGQAEQFTDGLVEALRILGVTQPTPEMLTALEAAYDSLVAE